MAFSADVKQELCRHSVSRRCCAQAEAYGILLFCSAFDRRRARIVTESPGLKERLPVLFRRAFKLSFDQVPEPGEGKGIFLLESPEKLRTVFDSFDLEWDGAVSMHINLARLEEEHCRTPFLRGAFLAGGSVTDPRRATTWSWPPPTTMWAGRRPPCCGRRASSPRRHSAREIMWCISSILTTLRIFSPFWGLRCPPWG